MPRMPAVKGENGGDSLKGLVIRIFVQDDLQANWSEITEEYKN